MDDNIKISLDYLQGLVYATINDKFYESVAQSANETGNKDVIRMVEAMNIIAKKHDMTFMEMFNIITELGIIIKPSEE